MVSFPKPVSRSASRPACGSDAGPVFERAGAPKFRADAPHAGGAIDDAAIRRAFETLAARIRMLQMRAAREAASRLAAR